MMLPRNDALKDIRIGWTTREGEVIGTVKSSSISDDGFTCTITLDDVQKEKKMNKLQGRNIDKIEIRRYGDNVVAKAYARANITDCSGYVYDQGWSLVGEASAKCGPNDIFDFNIGAKLALDRLYEGYDMTPKPKRKPYNGKIFVRCGKECNILKSNKIYNVSNGYIVNIFGDRVAATSSCNKPYIFEDMDEDELSDAVDINVFYGVHYSGDKDPRRHYTAYFVKE